MDQRGHGLSDGKTVLVPSVESYAMDQFKFHEYIVKKYKQRPKVLMLGHSMGCMVHLQNMDKGLYDAVVHVAPFYDWKDKNLVNLATPLIKVSHWFNRVGMTPEIVPPEKEIPRHMVHFFYDFDSPHQKKYFPVKTMDVFIEETKKIKQ